MNNCEIIKNICELLVDKSDKENKINARSGAIFESKLKTIGAYTISLSEEFYSDEKDDFFSLEIYRKNFNKTPHVKDYIKVCGDKDYITITGYKNLSNGTTREVSYEIKNENEYAEQKIGDNAPVKVDLYHITNALAYLDTTALFRELPEYEKQKTRNKKGTH